MRRKFCLEDYQKIHFIGIGGVSMSGIAKYLLAKNIPISGSDAQKSDIISELERLGVKVYHGHSLDNLAGVDAVITTSAIDKDNPELVSANQLGLPIFERSKVLGDILSLYKRSVAVAGCHGKTTATAMLTEILVSGGSNPTAFIGGDTKSALRFRNGGLDIAVAEACEYKKNLLDINPDIAVVLNIDNDHLDCYKDMRDITETFRKFTEKSLTVLNADDMYSDKLFNSATVTFGIDRPATYTARNIKYNGKGYTFTLCKNYRPLTRINLKVFGWHNIYNALAACTVADILGVSALVMKNALESFTGVKRRNEYLGERNGLKCYADYAHHPKEIKATLDAYNIESQRFLTVFQPHTYSRTKFLMQDFIQVLKGQNNLIIYKTYSAREDYDFLGSAKLLCDNLINADCNCEYIDEKQKLYLKLDQTANSVDKVLFLGAGDIYDIAIEYLKQK